MKKFAFRLENVLTFKQSLEQQALNKLAQIEAKIFTIRTDIDKVSAQFRDKKDELLDRLKSGENGAIVSQFTAFFNSLKDQKKSLEISLIAAERTRAEIREEIIAIMRERKSLERLKEKQYQAYLQEVKMEQEKDAAEILAYQEYEKLKAADEPLLVSVGTGQKAGDGQ